MKTNNISATSFQGKVNFDKKLALTISTAKEANRKRNLTINVKKSDGTPELFAQSPSLNKRDRSNSIKVDKQKSKYSGMFGDYSSFSNELDELSNPKGAEE